LQRADGVGGDADGWIDGGGLAAQPMSENGALVGPVNVVVDAGAKVQEARADGSLTDGCAPLGAGSDGSYVVTNPGESSEAVRAANPPPEDDVYVNVEVKVQNDQAGGPPSDGRASNAASGDGEYKGTDPGEYSEAVRAPNPPPEDGGVLDGAAYDGSPGGNPLGYADSVAGPVGVSDLGAGVPEIIGRAIVGSVSVGVSFGISSAKPFTGDGGVHDCLPRLDPRVLVKARGSIEVNGRDP
jgi:hypothetical protein